jgi:superfamily I DNA/RNA helicase
MRERIEKLVGDKAEKLWVSTFHSTCCRILRRDIEKLGYSNNFTIYDDEDQMSILKDILKQLNLSDKVYPPREIKSKIGEYLRSLCKRVSLRVSLKHTGKSYILIRRKITHQISALEYKVEMLESEFRQFIITILPP